MGDGARGAVSREDLIRMSADIVAAYVGRNSLPPAAISKAIGAVFEALRALDHGARAAAPKPAVPVHLSVKPDYLICLDDGKRLKMLKRHLRAAYGMSPDDYRAKWALPPDYPMVAPNYARERSEFAKGIGLGRKTGRPRKKRKKP